jgi:hypothetical protein
LIFHLYFSNITCVTTVSEWALAHPQELTAIFKAVNLAALGSVAAIKFNLAGGPSSDQPTIIFFPLVDRKYRSGFANKYPWRRFSTRAHEVWVNGRTRGNGTGGKSLEPEKSALVPAAATGDSQTLAAYAAALAPFVATTPGCASTFTAMNAVTASIAPSMGSASMTGLHPAFAFTSPRPGVHLLYRSYLCQLPPRPNHHQHVLDQH